MIEAPASVVCGGSAGIGLAAAVRLAAGEGRVAVLGRRADRIDSALEEVRGAGASDVVGIVVDATDDDQVAAAFGELKERWGAVNALVNAVGPAGGGRFDDLDDAAWQLAFDQGVLTAVRCIRHALPLLRAARWARIVNVTAVSTKHQSPGLIAYTASKAALASMTKNLARSLAPEGILVNAVAPGPVLTGGIKRAVQAAGGDGDDARDAYRVMAEQYGAHVDLLRVAEPSEVAAVIAFCASEANTYMTGGHLNVDGGSDFC
ncbi:MAG: 3-oxoacyl-[acyl-carrier protein] reductase [Acidimicrobiaceae bacterium]